MQTGQNKKLLPILENRVSSVDDDKEALTVDEVEEFRQIFTIYDLDGDGLIARSELPNILKAIGLNSSTETPQNKETVTVRHSWPPLDLVQVDESTSQAPKCESVDFKEFVRIIVAARRNTDPQADLREAFQMFDKDGDGYLTAKDLKQVMLNLGEKLTDEEVEEMVKEADVDRDGKINFDDFATMMSQTL